MPADPDPRTPEFPVGTAGRVRVSTATEVDSFLAAYPHPSGPWSAAGRMTLRAGEGTEEHLTLRAPDGTATVLRFDVGDISPQGGPGAAVERLMQAALQEAREQGPLHPGAMPRFPVPSAAYPGRVAVPLVLLATDDAGRRGVYGPDRLVVASWPDGVLEGVGDAPGFDPLDWPPRRLGDWPPPGLAGLPRAQVAGSVARFSALWGRLLTAYLTARDDPYQPAEAAEALALLGRLDVPGTISALESLSPAFWRWLRASG